MSISITLLWVVAAHSQNCPNVPLVGTGPSNNWHLPANSTVTVSYGNIPTQMGWDFGGNPPASVTVDTAKVDSTMNDSLDAWTDILSGAGNPNVDFEEGDTPSSGPFISVHWIPGQQPDDPDFPPGTRATSPESVMPDTFDSKGNVATGHINLFYGMYQIDPTDSTGFLHLMGVLISHPLGHLMGEGDTVVPANEVTIPNNSCDLVAEAGKSTMNGICGYNDEGPKSDKSKGGTGSSVPTGCDLAVVKSNPAYGGTGQNYTGSGASQKLSDGCDGTPQCSGATCIGGYWDTSTCSDGSGTIVNLVCVPGSSTYDACGDLVSSNEVCTTYYSDGTSASQTVTTNYPDSGTCQSCDNTMPEGCVNGTCNPTTAVWTCDQACTGSAPCAGASCTADGTWDTSQCCDPSQDPCCGPLDNTALLRGQCGQQSVSIPK